MKSQLFSRHDVTRSEDFAKDLKVLASLSDDLLAHLPEHLATIALTRSDAEREQALVDAAKALDIEPARMGHVADLGKFFIREFLSGGDAVNDDAGLIAADLRDMELIPADRMNAIAGCLRKLQALATTRVQSFQTERMYALSGLPALAGITTLVDFRAIFEDNFKVGYSVDRFSPKCTGIIPVIVIRLRLDDGPCREVHFQLDLRTIKLFIDHLRAAEEQVKIAERYLGLSKEEPQWGLLNNRNYRPHDVV